MQENLKVVSDRDQAEDARPAATPTEAELLLPQSAPPPSPTTQSALMADRAKGQIETMCASSHEHLDRMASGLAELRLVIDDHRDALFRSVDNLAAMTSTTTAAQADMAAIIVRLNRMYQDATRELNARG